MEEAVVVKLPVTVLAELVASADNLAEGVQALENLNRQWAVVFRTRAAAISDPPEGLKTQVAPFEDREEMVAFLEKAHTDPYLDVVAALKNGVPRNVKIKVQVQFR